MGVPLPSISSGSQSFGEDQSRIGRDYSSSTMVVKMSFCSLDLLESSVEPPRGAPTLGKTANAAQVEHIPSESTGAPASCLETIAQGVRCAGFSRT